MSARKADETENIKTWPARAPIQELLSYAGTKSLIPLNQHSA